jgi:ATP-dependent Lhr-like helicase
MGSEMNALSLFHPIISGWFADKFGRPTDVQEQAWPRIANDEHTLITAPTGSGKTLTAFLWAVNQLATRSWDTGHTSVLYVSPLRALNNDIRRNLLVPVFELKRVFEHSGVFFPDIRVQTRSGDTPQSERRTMLRHPPEILITTPESLNLLLSSMGGRSMLTGIMTVILDEIHAVVGEKRGVHLITAVDRLVPLCGEFQRIALSATVRPLESVAKYVGGFMLQGSKTNPSYALRPVSIVQTETPKQYDVHVRFPEEAREQHIHEAVWEPLVDELKRVIRANRSTLLFVNSRRLCEKLTLMINEGEKAPIAYAHHGSLSREIREEVERKLKSGELNAIVATNSLELGIDIGALDEVVLIQSPPSISSTIQRIGRAGHQVGVVSRGTLFPTHPLDFVEAAALAPAILSQSIEAVKPARCPLDVLAQVIVSMVGVETWDIDALYVRLKASYPYQHLRREHFELVLNMLSGRYAETRIRELRPRISVDRLDNTVAARKGALLALYTSGGTIPDRGYFHLRHQETNSLIGELDEEFVWESSLGQTFALGTQNWRIERITHNDVFVTSGPPKFLSTPFWKGEGDNRDYHFSARIGEFMEFADHHLDDPDFAATLRRNHCMDSTSCSQLIAFLKRQKEATGSHLPHRHHLLLEHVDAGPGSAPGNQVFLHTMWGGRVNRPYGLALDAAWEASFGHRLEIYTSDDCVVLLLPHEVRGEDLLSLVSGATIETFLRRRLEGSGFFGARFRECCGRSLLLARNRITERMPLWMSRLRSQKLLDAVLPYEDFPILLETWRTCLQDEFDLESLRQLLTELEKGTIEWSTARTRHPSPMAQGMAWRQINRYMYMGDEPPSGKASKLRDDLFRDIVYTPGLRPTINRKLVDQFESKRMRLSPGYSPSSPRELLDWVKERLLITASEFEQLLNAMHKDHGLDAPDVVEAIREKLVRITTPEACEQLVAALEGKARVMKALYGEMDNVHVVSMTASGEAAAPGSKKSSLSEEDRAELLSSLLGEWLEFYGPRTATFIRKTLGIESERLVHALEDLTESGRIVSGQLITGGNDDDLCDRENFEILLRLARSEAVPVFEALDLEWLPLFIASHQGAADRADNIDGLFCRLERLLCYPADADLWETEILPARLHPYSPSLLDTIMQEGDLRWIGSRHRRIAFCFESDLDLMYEDSNGGAQTEPSQDDNIQPGGEHGDRPDDGKDDLFPDARGRYGFSTLLQTTKLSPSDLGERLWEAVWLGRVTNDTFAALRRGIDTRFKAPEPAATRAATRRRPHRAGRHFSFAKWRSEIPFAGNWFRVSTPDPTNDLLEAEERNKDRVRVLLDRYGILFRELLVRELPSFTWPNVFRSLRLMELSGEVLSGCFFHGIPGLQFISHQAFRGLLRQMAQSKVYWLNAADPASLCGIQLAGLRGTLPRRVRSTHLVYRGNKVVMISERNGRMLKFHVPPNDPDLPMYFGPLHHLLRREVRPMHRISVEAINGEEAARSPYVDTMRAAFHVVVDYKHVTLYRGGNSWGSRV